MNTKHVSVHDIQLYLSRQLILHPIMSDAYERTIVQMIHSGKLSPLPVFTLNYFSDRIHKKQIELYTKHIQQIRDTQ